MAEDSNDMDGIDSQYSDEYGDQSEQGRSQDDFMDQGKFSMNKNDYPMHPNDGFQNGPNPGHGPGPGGPPGPMNRFPGPGGPGPGGPGQGPGPFGGPPMRGRGGFGPRGPR